MVCVFKWREILQAPFHKTKYSKTEEASPKGIFSSVPKARHLKIGDHFKISHSIEKQRRSSQLKAVELKASHQRIDNQTLYWDYRKHGIEGYWPCFCGEFWLWRWCDAAATDGELDGQSPAADLWWCTLRALCCSAMFTSMDLAAAARDASPYNTADCYPRPQLLWPSHCRFANTNIPLLTILSSPP